MSFLKQNFLGIFLCLLIAIPCVILGKYFPIIGGPVIAILLGMTLNLFIKNKAPFVSGIRFTSKKILQYAVILLGFGMNLSVIMRTGKQSLPIILLTISISLLIAFIAAKYLHMPSNIATLIGVGSSICGGSAIAATAPIIDANEEEVAQSISVIFFFNVIAALLFPSLGVILGFTTASGEAFGIFSGTAVNDTSSVTAVATTWDAIHHLGSQTLDKAITVKLTRTLAIIPITLSLAYIRSKTSHANTGENFSIKKIFPFFILFFVLASIMTTIALSMGVPTSFFKPFKELSKFCIIMAMAAIGLNTDIIKLVKNGGRPILLGMSCWIGIIITTLIMQKLLGIW